MRNNVNIFKTLFIGWYMSLLHFYRFPRFAVSKKNLLSMTVPEVIFLRIKWSSDFLKIFILFCLPFNHALAGEIYSTGFESGSLAAGQTQQNGFSWGVGKNTSVSKENPKSGSYSLKFTFPATVLGKDSDSEQKFNLGGKYTDLWIKYDLYIPSNYYHRKDNPANNKGVFHIWGGSYNPPGAEGPKLGPQFYPTGSDGGSELNMFAKAYIQDKIVLNKVWTCADCTEGKSSQGIVPDDKGHWMTITAHVKYASITNNDGICEVWKTNWRGSTIKLINIHDGPWYSTQPTSTAPARGFDTGYLLGWANSGFDKETIFYIDNIKFSTTPLVTNSSAPITDQAKPNPPIIK